MTICLVCLALILCAANLWAQPNISRIEYFIDTDPGYGNGITVSHPGTNNISTSFNIDLVPLNQGVHIVGVRSRDVNGAWSQDGKWIFLKPFASGSAPLQPNINRVEYYVDTDPGYGNGISLGVSPGQDLAGLSFNIDIVPLNPGVHIVGIRSRDANGAWSHDNKYLFVKPYSSAATIQPNITRVEYYVDTDPGRGNGTALPISPATDLPGLSFNVDLVPLNQGVHLVGIRSRDANGAWSHDNKWIFLKPFATGVATPQPNITRVEYYVDTDPGYGNGISLGVTPGTDLAGLSFNVNLLPLNQGVHIIGVRSRDANGAWSHDNKWIFLKPYANGVPTPQPDLVRIEYYIDNDPGYGNGITVPFSQGTDISNISFTADLTIVGFNGLHKMGIRAKDVNGAWCLDNEWQFTSNAALPVTLLNFYVVAGADEVIAYWSTATESNSRNFIVQRSTDGVHFDNIGSVAAAGNSNFVRNYSFDDVQAMQYKGRTLFYRLQQLDLNNDMKLSQIVKVRIGDSKNRLQLFTNPVTSQANLQYQSIEKEKVFIRVTDALGKLMLSKQITVESGSNSINLAVSAFAPGMYTVELQSSKGKDMVRMIKE